MHVSGSFLSALLFLAFVFQANAQQKHCLTKDSLTTSPPASLEDISWIVGNWQAEAFGGICEEVWAPPLGNSMMGMFKLVSKGRIGFYEIMTISEENETLIMRLKHFEDNLKGWEEKDETVDFELVKVEEDAVYFDGLTFKKRADGINVYVIIGSEDGKSQEAAFIYKKF